VNTRKPELMKSLREHLTDANIKRILQVGSIYASLEIIGLILSSLGKFETDIRLPVFIIVLFHLIYIPLMFLVWKGKIIRSGIVRYLLCLLYIVVILAWGAILNALAYLDEGTITVYTIAFLGISALFIINPRISIPLFLFGFSFFVFLINNWISDPLKVNSMVFQALIVTLVGFGISRENYKNRKELFFSEQSLINSNRKLKDQTLRDSMTGLFNNASIFDFLDKAIEYKQERGGELAILMLDLDHFKNINDTLGHSTGDEVIKESARKMLEITREKDIVGRYGGEEFLIILTETKEEVALKIAERIRKEIYDIKLEDDIQISCSIGLAVHKGESGEKLVHRADNLLYAAKQAGRNRVFS